MTVSVAQAQMFFLALTRILAIIIHLPVLGGRSIPDRVKIGFAFVMAMVILPWQPLPPEASSLSSIDFGLAIGREVLVGTLAGFAAVLTFGAVQIAGHLMGLGSGFQAGHILNPALEDNGSALDQVFLITAFLLFLVLNGHHTFLRALQQTFTILPLNSPLPALAEDRLLKMTAGLVMVGVQMSLPVMGALLLSDIALGLLARVAPQMQVFFLGVPLKIGLGLLSLALSIIILAPNLSELFNLLGNRMLDLLGA